MTSQLDTLILTFAPGRSLTAWSDMGRLDRERGFLEGLRRLTKRILFVSAAGARDHTIAASLSEQIGFPIDAISLAHDDPELGTGRTPAERVLARLGGSRRVVIQTMQIVDGGISERLIGHIRRAGIQAALVARGGFVESRVRAAAYGPHAYAALAAGAEEASLCRHAQIVVGASRSVTDDICWRHGINPARTRVITHFADLDLKEAPEIERSNNAIVAVGTLTPSRGLLTVIQAVARLPEHMREAVKLEIIGEGPQRDQLSRTAAELGVSLSLPGRLPHAEVIQRLRTCAVFIHASPLKRQSRSVLEALACGCAAVVSDVPEFDGLVENASTGIRIKPTPESFAFALESTLSDADWRAMLGSAAARTVRSACSLDKIIELTGKAYEDALSLSPEAVKSKMRRAG